MAVPSLPGPGLSLRRQLTGAGLGIVGVPVLVVVLVALRSRTSLDTPVLVVLLAVVVCALVGGLRPALPAAVGGGLAIDYWFTTPLHTLAVERGDQVVVLVAYLLVALAVSVVVDLAERRRAEAVRAGAQAQALSSVAGATLAESSTLPALLEQVRRTFAASEVRFEDRTGLVVAVVGAPAPEDLPRRVPAGQEGVLVLLGPELIGADRRVLSAFAEAAATALAGRRLAERAEASAQADRQRSALLAAVSHDLRTPLAGIKLAVTSLRSDIAWSPGETAELLETVEDQADRLQGLVANLLDASRLDAGALVVTAEPVVLDGVAARALLGLSGADRVTLDVDEALPVVETDPGLLERVLVNLLDNALRHTTGSVELRAAVTDEDVRLAVVDHGAGLTAQEQLEAFTPFRAAGDRAPGGVGLGLTVVKGLTEALGGHVATGATAGGGLTVTVVLPLVLVAA